MIDLLQFSGYITTAEILRLPTAHDACFTILTLINGEKDDKHDY
jgi:hypothetical protein